MECKKHLFSIDDHVTYLNTGYMSPSMKAMDEAGRLAVNRKSKPYLFTTEDFFNPAMEVKKLFSRLIHAPSYNQIALIPSVSYGLASITRNITLLPYEEVLVVEDQFPSNIYPWTRLLDGDTARLKIIGPDSIQRGKSWNKNILHSINEKTKVVALPHVHWSEGIIYDLVAIRKKCDEMDARLIIDGTQSVGALPFSVQDIRPDALICAGYKWLMGPYSLGCAYYSEKWNDGIPIEENWSHRKDSDAFSKLTDYQDAYRPGAARYSVGESSNFVLLPMMQMALNTLMEWGPKNVQSYCRGLSKDVWESLPEIGFTPPDEGAASHLFGIKIPDDVDINTLSAFLRNENIYVSMRGRYIRVSPWIVNEQKDLLKLKDTLVRFTKDVMS